VQDFLHQQYLNQHPVFFRHQEGFHARLALFVADQRDDLQRVVGPAEAGGPNAIHADSTDLFIQELLHLHPPKN